MARQYAPLYTSIWQDEQFKALSADAQRLYLLAVSQPNVSWCGVVPFTARRWATYAKDTTAKHLTRALIELVAADFVVLDGDTEELWVRSFIKHNVLGQPKLIMAAQREMGDVHSLPIRTAIGTAYGWASDTSSDSKARGSSRNAESSVLGVGVKGSVSSDTEQPLREDTNTNTELHDAYEQEAGRQADVWLTRDPSSIVDRAGWVRRRTETLTAQHGAGGLPSVAKPARKLCKNADCRDGFDYSQSEPVPCEACSARAVRRGA